MTDKELDATYRLLHTKWEEACLTLGNQKKTIGVFQKKKDTLVLTITILEEEIALLNSKLENMTKFVCMLNNGSNILDEILEVGKTSINLKGIGFEHNKNKKNKIHSRNFVLPEKKNEFLMLNHVS